MIKDLFYAVTLVAISSLTVYADDAMQVVLQLDASVAQAKDVPVKPARVSRGNKVKSGLAAAVKAFEKAGGKGAWFKSENPYSGVQEQYYLITALPEREDLQSPLWLLRQQDSFEIFKNAIGQSKVPVVLSENGDTPDAAALGKKYFPLAAKALELSGSTLNNIVLIKTGTSKYFFVHELRHWTDFEEAGFLKPLSEMVNKLKLSQEEISNLVHVVWEVRGYAAQERSIKNDLKSVLPLLQGSTIVTDPAELQSSYDGELRVTYQTFEMNNYDRDLKNITEATQKKNKKLYSELINVLLKYDLFTDDKDAKMSFRFLLGMP